MKRTALQPSPSGQSAAFADGLNTSEFDDGRRVGAVMAPSLRIVGRRIGEAWSYPVALAILAGLTFIGTRSVPLGIAAVCLAALLVVLLCFDLAPTGTAFVTLAVFLAPLNDLRLGASHITFSDLVFVLGFAVLTPTILRNKIDLPPPFVVGLGILLTMGIVASVASPITFVSANQVARLLVGAFSLPVFFMVWRPPTRVIVRLASAYIAGSVFSVGYGLIQGPVAGGGRYIGFTIHPNYFALSCLLAATLVPWVVVKVVHPGLRWIFWGAAVVLAYGVFISGSRASLLVLIMIIAIYPFVEGSIRAVGAVLFGFAAVLAFSGELTKDSGDSALGRLLGNGTASGSDTERQKILSEAWDLFLKHPLLGNGFDGGLGSHNIYLQVAVAVGVFGLFGYLLILWTALRPLFWSGINHRLAYPVLAYAAVGPLTNTLWDRLIWSALALTFAVNLHPPKPEQQPTDDLTEIRTPA